MTAPPPGVAAPLTLAPSAAAAARGPTPTTTSAAGVTLLRYEFVPAGVDGGGKAGLEVEQGTGEYTLTRSCSNGKPPIRFAGHAAARRPGSASLDGGGGGRDGSATASGNADDDVECVAVYGGGTWTLHAVEAAVSLRVKRGEEVTTARPPALPPRENADDNDATTSDDELGAELEAALEEEEEGRRQPPQQPAPARGTLPSAELNDVEREFLGRG